MKEKNAEDKEIQLSLNTEELIDTQNNDHFCSTMLKLINDKIVSSDKYFISYDGLLNKGVREGD